MKAVAVFPAKRQVRLIERAEPRIAAPHEVKLRMIAVGVCGTDRAICTYRFGTPPAGSDYFVLGHESLAEVIEAGPAVERAKPGDLVVTSVRRPCAREWCTPCRAGQADFCMSGDYFEHGIKDLDGFMTELVVDEDAYLHVVPRELREVAVLVEPLTIAEKALLQVRRIQQRLPWHAARQRAVVLGAGPVGLLGTMAMVEAGYQTFVYSLEAPDTPPAAIARDVGARYFSSQAEPVEKVTREIGNVDVVYEATGASPFSFEMLGCLGANGVFICTGFPNREKAAPLESYRLMHDMVLKNQVMLGTVNAGREAFEAAIRDLAAFYARWPAAVRALITGHYPIEGFADLVYGTAGGIKNVIRF